MHNIQYSTLYSSQCTVHYTVHNIQYSTLYSAQYTVQYILHSTLYSAQYIGYSTLYSVQYLVYSTLYNAQYTVHSTISSVKYCRPDAAFLAMAARWHTFEPRIFRLLHMIFGYKHSILQTFKPSFKPSNLQL